MGRPARDLPLFSGGYGFRSSGAPIPGTAGRSLQKRDVDVIHVAGAWFFPAGVDVVDVEVLPACVLNGVTSHSVIAYLIAEPHVAGPDIKVHAIPVVIAVADSCNPQPKLGLEVAAGRQDVGVRYAAEVVTARGGPASRSRGRRGG